MSSKDLTWHNASLHKVQNPSSDTKICHSNSPDLVMAEEAGHLLSASFHWVYVTCNLIGCSPQALLSHWLSRQPDWTNESTPAPPLSVGLVWRSLPCFSLPASPAPLVFWCHVAIQIRRWDRSGMIVNCVGIHMFKCQQNWYNNAERTSSTRKYTTERQISPET